MLEIDECAYIDKDAALWLTARYNEGMDIDALIRIVIEGVRAMEADLRSQQSDS